MTLATLNEAKKYLSIILLLLALFLLGAGAYLISPSRGLLTYRAAPSSPAPTTATGSSYRPPLTYAVQAQLAASKGFQALISYTDSGFEPADISIKKGDTVRFTNNSSGKLHILDERRPAATSTCPQGRLDSCRSLSRGEFFEYTFAASGEVRYTNGDNYRDTGTIRIK